ncbi:MAG: transaldolase [Actinobacteria bacterium]|nr:transaldolase [Actinomycetota bacterium]
MKIIEDLKIKIFADGADKDGILEMYKKPYIKGFTTNPTLMRKAGVTDYRVFAKEVLREIPDLPISFEVFSDDFIEMERQALEIAGWGKNVYVKIPITNTKGELSIPLIRKLSASGIFLNVTAILTVEQVKAVARAISSKSKTIVSIFAGRIADTGRDSVPYMKEAASILKLNQNAELLWASTRELLNIFQAESCGCHIITVTNDILKKLEIVGKDLRILSLDTVKMFYRDGKLVGYKI